MSEEVYHYNGEPLQLSYRNTYTPPEKIEIVLKLQEDYEAGMVSDAQVRWIVNNAKFGSFTIMKIIDKLLFEKKCSVCLSEILFSYSFQSLIFRIGNSFILSKCRSRSLWISLGWFS